MLTFDRYPERINIAVRKADRLRTKLTVRLETMKVLQLVCSSCELRTETLLMYPSTCSVSSVAWYAS